MSTEAQTYKDNAVCHFDISGPEFEPLKVFYSKVFGWKVDEKGPGYALIGTPSPKLGLSARSSKALTQSEPEPRQQAHCPLPRPSIPR